MNVFVVAVAVVNVVFVAVAIFVVAIVFVTVVVIFVVVMHVFHMLLQFFVIRELLATMLTTTSQHDAVLTCKAL